jgi:ankyrin repeat protein
LPRDLETIYCGLLNNLPLQWREEAPRAFSILRISFERLSSQQLSLFVTIWRFDCTSPTFNLRAVEDERSDFEIYLHERCGYIVRKNENGLVNFAHQSAKDLFNGQSQLPANASVLNQYTMSEPDAHSLLFLMCMKVFQAEATCFTQHEVRYMISQLRYEADKSDLPLEKRFVMRISVLKSSIQKKSRTACLLYALSIWFEHYVKATPSVELDMEADRFVKSIHGPTFHMLWAEIISFPAMVAQHIEVTRSPFSPLLSAITRGDSRRLITAMIESGSSPNIMPHNITPLSWAIICNRQDAFLALMRSDAVSVNFGKQSQSIAIHYAASSPNPFFINYMVEDSRANLNYRGNEGRTPLLEAIRTKRLDSALLLLEQPYIDVWAADDKNVNALTMALQHPMWEDVVLRIMSMDWNSAMEMAPSTAKLLELARMHRWNQVENGLLGSSSHALFQIDEYTGLNPVSALVFYGRRTDIVHYLTRLSRSEIRDVASSGQYNLLHLCAHQDWLDLVEEPMKKYGLHPVTCDHANRTLLHWALEYSWAIDERKIQVLAAGNINQKDNDGMTPLHLAVSKRNMAIIRWLVAAQADIFSRDNRGFTPAHLAASEGYREGVEFFINLTKRDFGKTKDGSSLTHLMSFWLEGSVIRQFVESRRTSVNMRDKKRCTPLHCAAQTGNVSAVKVLLEKGCQVDAKDLYGQTALHHAIRSGASEVPPILLQNEADMDLKDLYDQTCLHLSIRHRHEGLTKWLISRKMDMVFERDQFGFTPLHRACSNGTANEVLELLRAGADILELDSNFLTPLEHAVIGRNESTTILILQRRRTDKYRAREWIRSMNTALRTSIAKGFPEIESILMEAGAWVADRSKI